MENQPTGGANNAGQTMGIAALILGIIAIPLAFFPCTIIFAWIPAGLAIIFGAVGLNQAKKGNAKTGLPIAGLVLGIISTLAIVAWIVFFAEAASEVKTAIENDSTMFQMDTTFQEMEVLDTLQLDSVQ